LLHTSTSKKIVGVLVHTHIHTCILHVCTPMYTLVLGTVPHVPHTYVHINFV
jgi:hypothetical protein